MALGMEAPASANSDQIVAAKQRLNDQGFYCGVVNELVDDLTTCAVRAYQKAHTLEADGILDVEVMVALKTVKPVPRFSTTGWAVEVDIARQLLRIVHDGSIVATVHATTGDRDRGTYGSRQVLNRTPTGKFRLTTASANGAAETSLGTLFRPHYFWNEYAVYGRPDMATVDQPATLGGVAVHSLVMPWLEDSDYLPAGRLVVVR